MAKPRRNTKVRLLGVVRRRRAALLVSTALSATVTMVVSLPAAAQPAPNARPTGGMVVGGSATISQSTSQTTINQSTQRGAINWQTFNVGSQQSVQFNQPSSSAVTLNQVQTPNPSQIAGKIGANGQIIIENQSGVVFYKGSQVNTAGLMVSAVSSSPAAVGRFINGGNLVMDQAALPGAKVVNQGNITVRQAGLAALVAPQVRNDGVITATLGRVVLAGASKATLDLYGDGMMSIDVTGMVTKLPNGTTALVTNTGTIIADGGTVQLTAREADGLVTTLVDAGGKIRANSIGGKVGTVTLNGVGGSIIVEGQLDAIGTAPGTKGGSVAVNASGNVTVASGARINASGQAGGGLVAIGTTLKRAAGGPGVTARHTAANVTVQRGASIAANATAKGNGGRVTVLSTGTTTMNGTISAMGGPLGGNGGFVELSGGNVTSATGLVDVSAPFGNLGTILLDPDNLDIVPSGGGLDGSFTGTVTTGQDSGSTDTLSGTALSNFTGNVLLQAKFTIDVQSSFSLSAGSLTMEAGQLLAIESGVNVGASGNIILATGGAGPGTPPTAQANPTISILGSVASSGGSVSLLAGTGGTISIGDVGLVQAASGTSITLQGDSMAFNDRKIEVPGGTLEIAPATSGNAMDFSGTGSGTLTVPTLTSGSIVASTLRLGAVTIGGTETTTAGSITFDTGVNLTGVASTLDVETTGTVSQTASGSLTAGTLIGNASTGLTLNQAENNHIGTVGSFNAGVIFALITAGSVTVAGPVVAPGIQIENDANTMSVTGSLGATDLISLQTLGTLSIGTGATLNSPSVTMSGVAGITLIGNAVVGQTGATVDLSATAGNVTQANTGTIIAATLQSFHGVSGTADLLGTANAIGAIGSFAVTSGDFLLTDTTALSVGNTLSAGGNVYLQTSDTVTGITIAAGATVSAGTGELVGFQTDKFANSGTVIGGTFELAPNSSTVVTLGATGSRLSLIGTTGITANTLRIGAVTQPGSSSPTTTASTIDIAGTFNAGGMSLDLRSNGTITQEDPLLDVATLTGSAVSGVTLASSGNTIAALGAFTVTGGGFTLIDTGSLSVAGVVGASNIALDAGTIGIPGTLNAGTVVALGASAGGISETGVINAQTLTSNGVGSGTIVGGATLSGANTIASLGTVAVSGGDFILNDTGSLSVAGIVAAPNITLDAGTIAIPGTLNAGTVVALGASAGGITETGAINAQTLTSNGVGSGTIVGGATLSGTNTIASLGTVAVSGGDFTLLDIGSLSVAGLVVAPNITLGAGTIGILGTLNAGTVVALSASAGGITETGVINAQTLTSNGVGSGTIVGGATLSGANTIASLGTVAVSGGDFILNDTGSLSVAGIVAAPNITLDAGTIAIPGTLNAGTVVALGASAGGITETGAINAQTLTSNGVGSGTIVGGATLSGANTIASLGTVAVSGGDFTLDDTGTLTVTGAVSAPNVALNDGTIGISGTLHGTTGVTLGASAGGVAESGTGLIITPLLESTGTIVGGATLTGSNTISTLESFAVSGGNLIVNDTGELSILDVVAAPNIALNAGTISITGTLNAGTVLALGASAGGITEAGMINAPTLTSTGVGTGTIVGGATLTGTNTIAALDGFILSSGSFDLLDAGAGTLTVSTLVSAPAVSIQGAGTTLIDSGVTATTGTLFLSSGSIAFGSSGVLSGGVVDLNTTSGGISEGSGSIIATTLQSSITLVGTVDLSGINTIGTLGRFVVNTGSFDLADSSGSDLSVTGSVSASSVTLSAGTIGVSGSIIATDGLLSLTSAPGGIALTGNALLNGGTVDLASATGITQTGSTEIDATLFGASAAAGTIDLPSLINNIGTVTGLNGSGGVTLVVDPNLVLTGTITGPVVFLEVAQAGGVLQFSDGTTPATLTATAATNPTISLLADNITEVGTGNTIIAANGTLEIAPFTTGTAVFLGGTSSPSGLGVDTTLLGFINTGTNGLLRIGEQTGTVTAGSITIAGAVNLGTVEAATLELDSTGSIFEPGSLSLAVTTLTGSASSAILLGTANAIGTLAAFTLTSGDLRLVDGSNLTIAGAVSAADIFVKVGLNAGTLEIGSATTGATLSATAASHPTISFVADAIIEGAAASTITATGGTVAIAPFSSGNAISLGGSLPASGTLVVDETLLGDISTGTGTLQIGSYNDIANRGAATITAGSISVDGSVDLNGHATTLLLNSLGAIAETNPNSIQAGTLVGTAGGDVSLTSSNTIGTLAGFMVTGGTFDLVEAGSSNLAVTGSVLATGVALSGAALTTITAGITATSGTVHVSSGSITLDSGGLLTGSVVDIDSTSTLGGITEINGGLIDAGTLLSSAGSNGNVDLGSANNVGTVGGFVVSGGTFHLDNGGTLADLAVTGPLIASSVTLDGFTGTLAVGGTIAATTTLTGLVLLQGSGTLSAIALNSGAVVTGPTIDLNAGNVAMTGNASLGQTGALVEVTTSSGGLTEQASASIIAGTLFSAGGIDGNASLAGTNNAIAALGSIAVTSPGTFNLVDSVDLDVNGPLTATAVTIDDVGSTLTVIGSLIAGGSVSLTAGNIAIPGLVSDGGAGTTSLIANAGTIGETGTLIAGTLSGEASIGGTVSTAVSLMGATPTSNAVATLGSFTASSFTLQDGRNLAVNGPLGDDASATITLPPTATLTVGGTIVPVVLSGTIPIATSVSLTAGNITIPGTVSDGGAGTTSLIATQGTINETGTLIAGTLSGSSSNSTMLTGATPTTNRIASIGRFVAQNENFFLNDGESLVVEGTIIAGNALGITDSGDVTNNGLIQTLNNSTITATGSITNNGRITEGLGSLTLAAGTDIANIGTISTGVGNGALLAGGNISNSGTIAFAGDTTLNAVGSINDASSGVITGAGFPVGNGANVLLLAQTGSISEAAGGMIAATNPTVDAVQLTATVGNITVGGAITAAVTTNGIGHGTVRLTAGGSITQTGGSIVAGAPGTIVGGTLMPSIALVAQTGTIGQSGGALMSATNAAGAILLNAPGNISFAGTISAPGAAGIVSLVSGAAIAETAGTGVVQAGTLTGSAGLGATLSTFTATTGNLVANLGRFTTGSAGAGDFVLVDGESLTVGAPVIAEDGSVSLTATHFGTMTPSNLTNNATILASGGVTLLADNDITNNLSIIAQGGTASLTASAGTLTNNDLILASTSVTLAGGAGLTNTGSVMAQTGNAALTATLGTLFNSGLISATAANAVVTLTALGGPIVQQGAAAGIITSLTAGGTVVLDAGGSITQAGSLIADLLTGSAGGTVSLGTPIIANGGTSGTDQVADLGSFTATGTFTLNDSTNLAIGGTVTAATIQAATIQINDPLQITLNNGTFVTGGVPRPLTGLTMASQLPPQGTTNLGAYLTASSVIQANGGTFTVANLPATTESVLAISLLPNSPTSVVQFNALAGLQAPATWLVLSIGQGQASGAINVRNLDLVYATPPARPGKANLSGMVTGFTGFAAAAAGFIEPQPNASFRLDGCPIHSITCALLPTQGVPVINPANIINIGVPYNQENSEDLVLPVISDERYELLPCNDPHAPQGCPVGNLPTLRQ